MIVYFPQNATAEYPARIAARTAARDALTTLDARFAQARPGDVCRGGAARVT